MVYKLTKFHNQSNSQTGFMTGGTILPHRPRIQGPKSPGKIGLRKEINRLLSKEMSNIFSKVTIEEKNWRSQNINFLGLKNLSPCQFWGAPTHEDIIEFQNFLLKLKNQRSGNKTVCGFFCYFRFERNYDVWKSKIPAFCWTKILTLIKTERNRKSKIPHIVLERRTLCFNSFKNHKLKIKLRWVGARERKKRAFFLPFILSEWIFLTFVFYLNLYCI